MLIISLVSVNLYIFEIIFNGIRLNKNFEQLNVLYCVTDDRTMFMSCGSQTK